MNARANVAPLVIRALEFENVLSREECEAVITFDAAGSNTDWWIGVDDTTKRSAQSKTITPTRSTQWIYARLQQVFEAANLHFGFAVERVGSDLLLASYSMGDHFDWHIDLDEGETEIRKLSIVVCLSDENAFEGGEWQFNHDDVTSRKGAIGSAVVFPSYLPHRVTPVRNGLRHALVGWMCGPRFT